MTQLDSSIADRARLMEALVALAGEAGDLVWQHFNGECAVYVKADESPVTAADHAAEAVILHGLAERAPGIPVVAEEEAAAGRIPEVGDRYFLVDPLDGTREFVDRGTDFTVNIGLIEHGRPTLGVIYAPARGLLVWGDVGEGHAWRADRPAGGTASTPRTIHVRACESGPCALSSSRQINEATQAWLDHAGAGSRTGVGSSLKFALLASGEADVYPRPAPTMEWDTCAGDAILRAAGGRTLDLDGNDLAYGKPGFLNPGFLATGGYDPAPLRSFL